MVILLGVDTHAFLESPLKYLLHLAKGENAPFPLRELALSFSAGFPSGRTGQLFFGASAFYLGAFGSDSL